MNSIDLNWPLFSVNLEKIKNDMRQKCSVNFDGLICNNTTCSVIFKDTIADADTTIVNNYWSGLTAAYFQPTMSDMVDASLANATAFGATLIEAFKKSNVMAGITVYNKTKPVSDYLHWMNHYLEQGSLYAAIQQIDIYLADTNRASLGLSPFVTDDVLTNCKHQIQDYLQVPRT